MALLAALCAAVAVVAVVRYLPAVRSLQDGRDALLDAEALLHRGGGISLSPADRRAATQRLETARDDFGARSAAVQDGWLGGALVHVPWLGDQVRAVRELRAAGGAGARIGLDLLPIAAEVESGSGDASRTGLLTRLVDVAEQHDRLARAAADVDALDAALGALPDGWLVGPLDHLRSTARREGPPLVRGIRPALTVLAAVPDAVGQGTHRYLLLLTNPGEERPGGGFIGAVGEMEVSDGRVISSSFRSSDFTDHLVPGVPAPRPIGIYTSGLWTLADSGWSPDFPTAAAAAAHFYTTATGEHLDGVIDVDPVALGYVLAVLGPVRVPPYPQTVDGANALTELNYIINQARPGDPGKAYLPPFGQAMLDELFHVPSARWLSLADALRRGVEEKHIVLDFDAAHLQRLAADDHATGSLPSTCQDCLLVADANLSATKGDLYVTRHFDLGATVDARGRTADRLTLTYHNPRPPTPADAALVQYSGGQYQDYLRVYLPPSARFDQLLVGEAPSSPQPVSPEDLGTELGRPWVAYDLVVPVDGTVTVVVLYSGPFARLEPDGRVTYRLAWEKQVDALTWPVTVSVTMADGRTRRWTSDLSRDRSWEVSVP